MAPSSASKTARLILAASLCAHGAAALGGVVISEIHYKPPAGDEALEFVELANDSGTPEDLSGYAFVEGIYFVFPERTILSGRGTIAVCANAQAVRSRYGIENAIGDFTGRLDSGGERISLANHAGVVIQSVRYRDRGKWPAAPYGTGHSLVLKDVRLDPAEPESWTQSPELGGSPGKPNFSTGPEAYVERVLVDRGAIWRYARGTGPFSTPETAWRAPSFDDSLWPEGPSGFGYGDGDDATELSDMLNSYTTVAIRRKFVLSPGDLSGPGDFYLGCDYDDGFIAYLNEVEIARANAGSPGEERAWDAVATGSREAGVEEVFKIPKDRFRAGENLLAIVGFNFSVGSSDFSLIPRLLHRAPPGGVREGVVVFNELHRGATPGAGWVELHNASDAAVDLSGAILTDRPERADPHVLPEGSVVPARGFLVIDETPSRLALSQAEVRLFLRRPGGTVIAASVFARPPPPGLGPGWYSECRFPDGGPLEWVTATPSRGAPNQVQRVTDIVLNEIFYHPPDERPGEFIELYNKGLSPIDISGYRFDDGIEFTFPEGTVLGPGAYLVVAEDPRILSENYGYDEALGPYSGRLANAGENVRLVDRAGNTVDEVRYREGGAWSRWADGGGSSLEVIDPDQDNSVGSAWDASDESSKAPWERLAFSVPNYVPATESELHLYLAERGTCLVDDVSVARGGTNYIPNPGFESGISPWVLQGTHVGSRRVTTGAHSGSACLELTASGKGDTLVNRVEIETSPRLTAGAYEVSLWARWIRGGSLLVAHGEYTAGAYGGRPAPAVDLSGNSLSAGLRLSIPKDLGTPGAENSARAKLRAETGSGNLGPVLSEVQHRPASPSASDRVLVTARISAARGVAAARVYYREGNPSGVFSSAPLFDDGLHEDGGAGDGLYAGEIPALAQGTRVVFYVEAADVTGAYRRFPADAPAHTCLYLVQAPAGSGLDAAAVVLDTARTSELQSRPLHSNDLLPGTFVFRGEEVYYNVGVRYRGSPWGRPGQNNYRVRFQEDKPFRRTWKKVNLDNSGGGPNEGAAYYLSRRIGNPAVPAPASDYEYVRTWLNSASIGLHGLLQPVDRHFLETWYGDAERSQALKVEGRRQFNDSGGLAAWDGASFIYRGENKENYRNYFIPAVRRSVDDWTRFIALAKVMDRRVTANAQFDEAIESALDVEAFLRGLAPRILQSDWDAFCVGNGHNGYLVFDPRDGRWELVPFDMDNTFGSTAISLFPATDPDVARLMSRPRPRRLYYRILWEYVEDRWSSARAGPYLDALQSATGLNFAGVKSYLDTTAAAVRSAVRSSTTVSFRILTNSGADFTTAETEVALSGEAPVQVAEIFYLLESSGEPERLSAAWSTPTRWSATFELPEAVNRFEFLGFDSAGNLIASARIEIISLARLGSAFVRGDANGDWIVDVSDAVATLLYLFHGRTLRCADAADFDDSGTVGLTDAILGLDYLFRDGAPPPAPFPEIGLDPTPDGIECG